MSTRRTVWDRVIAWSYFLMVVVAGVAALLAWLYIGDLPDRIVSGTGPGGLRHAQKEAVWLYPFMILGLLLLGLFTQYLRRVAPEMVNLSGRTKPGMDRERNQLQGAMIAVTLLSVGINMAFGPYRLWQVNTGQAPPEAVFGLSTFVSVMVPLVLIFGAYVVVDRRRYRE